MAQGTGGAVRCIVAVTSRTRSARIITWGDGGREGGRERREGGRGTE